MANITIPNLPSAIALTGSEQVEVVQSNTSVRTTTQAIANLATVNVNAITSLTINSPLYASGSNPIISTGSIGLSSNGVTNNYLGTMPTLTLKGNNTGSTAAPTDLSVASVMTMLGAAPLASPTFTGTPRAPTPATSDNSTQIATTAFVKAQATGSSFTRTTITASGGQTTFSVSYSVGSIQVYLNGVMLVPSDYTATSGTSVVLGLAAAAGDIFDAFSFAPQNTTGIVPVVNGGSGTSSLSGYVYGNGTSPFTASTTIPATALSGTLPSGCLTGSYTGITGVGTLTAVTVLGTTGSSFKVYPTDTGSTRNGYVEILDGTWAPPGTGAQYYNRYFNIEMTVGLSNRGTVSQVWNTQNVIMSRAVVTSASMANSHTIMDLAYNTIPAGLGDGGGGVLDGGGLPVNPNYQEIGGYAYNATILSPGMYNEGIASYFYDYTGAGVGVAAKSSNFFSVVIKKSATNTYATYGYQAYSAGTQQTTYAPTAAYRVDGGWLAGLDLTGQGAGNYGIDLNGNGATTAIRLPYNKSIVSRDSGNANDVTLMALAGTSIYLGAGSALTTAIFANPSVTFAPAVDNAISCGLGGGSPLRWTSVWAVNGTIQTSDASLKTNIRPLPDAMPIVASINPVTYTWIVGGQEYQDVWEEKTVQATAIENYEETEVTMIDGVAVQTKTAKTRDVLLWDDHPVIDEDGNPVMIRVRNGKGEDGEPIFNLVPKTHQTPIMVTKRVKVSKLVDKPGKRTHWGFLADNVQKVMEGTGRDFGGYVEDEGGTKHLRPDQLVPILWKAVQELAGKVAALEARA